VDAARREALRIALELLEALLREAYLVGRVVDREVRAVAETRRLTTEDPAARGVKRHHPARARRRPDEVLDAVAHLARRLVRERNREDLRRLDAERSQEMGDATRKNTRLTGAGAGD
jgi:hypothetical protein